MKEFCLMFIACAMFGIAKVQSAPSAAFGLRYLQHFGYTGPDTNPRLGTIMTQDQLSEAVAMFQRFAGLEITGKLDTETLLKMDQPRCGNPDVVGTEIAARKKRYALQGSKWDKKELTYKITSHTRDLSRHETEHEIAEGFKVWEKESGLTFRKVRTTDRADIEIKFARGAHGDGDPFDGRSKTLAHAFFPEFGGDAHFDEDEPWAISPTDGVSLMIVSAHEFGHSLGLSHSDVNSALMAPFYNPNYKRLDIDDIRAIRRLYGPPEDRHKPDAAKTTPRVPRPTKRPRPGPTRRTTTTDSPPVGACNGRFDAITMLENGTTFAFKDGKFWRLNDQGMEKGYPQNTRPHWGFTGKIDASLTYRQYTDFFQGRYVRRYVNGIAMRGYPRLISDVYPGIPSNLDAAYEWSGNGRIYFVKGNQYWRFNPSIRRADKGYPKPLTVWKGLPKSLDAALKWKDRTYFFKNGYYWRFDDEKVEVAQSLKIPYPRRSDEWWLGCTDNTLKISGDDVLAGKDEEDDDGGSGHGSRLSPGVLQIALSLLFVFSAQLFS